MSGRGGRHTEAAGQLRADLQLVQGLVALQGLRIGVDSPELHTLQAACMRGRCQQCVWEGQAAGGGVGARVLGGAHRQAALNHAVHGVAAAPSCAYDLDPVGGRGDKGGAAAVERVCFCMALISELHTTPPARAPSSAIPACLASPPTGP